MLYSRGLACPRLLSRSRFLSLISSSISRFLLSYALADSITAWASTRLLIKQSSASFTRLSRISSCTCCSLYCCLSFRSCSIARCKSSCMLLWATSPTLLLSCSCAKAAPSSLATCWHWSRLLVCSSSCLSNLISCNASRQPSKVLRIFTLLLPMSVRSINFCWLFKSRFVSHTFRPSRWLHFVSNSSMSEARFATFELGGGPWMPWGPSNSTWSPACEPLA
mmetsp:Transcript_24079/g.60096  ORF Transcript_24079/g.60096 Transcript_24079/m.60096 type:complete len:222 (+) Transcript_24079:170-835(+)